MHIKVRGKVARHDSATGDESLKEGESRKGKTGTKKSTVFRRCFSKTNDF